MRPSSSSVLASRSRSTLGELMDALLVVFVLRLLGTGEGLPADTGTRDGVKMAAAAANVIVSRLSLHVTQISRSQLRQWYLNRASLRPRFINAHEAALVALPPTLVPLWIVPPRDILDVLQHCRALEHNFSAFVPGAAAAAAAPPTAAAAAPSPPAAVVSLTGGFSATSGTRGSLEIGRYAVHKNSTITT
eukprot:CAMPEP_0182942998 /NCGR_PEP_ID=MMETSP0105_2-20130417/51653_1 /TAXON_ID=81532 ORGANISM="Acanthoeca-like sp., Strain 10tr" /NCGR_SAMPLE_ID=MMETSP0105_2 /ASSEMBLY_ACC=CAM_ASM_000205 /LENGTH=189 /DNA_ID=CAMNT_0025082799 /DNA_START=121 /DNA_END=690 /DNA_ORIENTATION=+